MKKLIRITTVPVSLRTLLKGQLRYMSKYYDVLAVSSDGDCFDQMLEEQGVPGYRVDMTRKITPFRDLGALVKLIKLFRKEKPFIVHTHTPKAGLLGMLAAKVAGVPHRLHTVAGLPLLVATDNKRRLLNIIERVTSACATKIYPNSTEMLKIMEEQRLANPKKMRVLANGSSNGIDTDFFDPEKVDKYVDEKVNGKFVFTFVGRVVKDKGINELVDAFVSLNKEKPDTVLLLVGGFEKELDAVSPNTEREIETNNAIHYVGYQSDVRGYLKASDVFVFASYREGFPNVVMQAGAMGIPSVVSNINGCNEIINHGTNGMIIPVRDVSAIYETLKELYDDRVKCRTMSACARDMIRDRYEQKVVWEAILNEYKSLDSYV